MRICVNPLTQTYLTMFSTRGSLQLLLDRYIFDPDDGGSTLLRNVDELPDYTASYPRTVRLIATAVKASNIGVNRQISIPDGLFRVIASSTIALVHFDPARDCSLSSIISMETRTELVHSALHNCCYETEISASIAQDAETYLQIEPAAPGC
jgi:hypothetical protein